VTADELLSDMSLTIADLSQKVREAVLAGNSSGAEQWSAALQNTCGAYDYLVED
jgi:hypothetical protein